MNFRGSLVKNFVPLVRQRAFWVFNWNDIESAVHAGIDACRLRGLHGAGHVALSPAAGSAHLFVPIGIGGGARNRSFSRRAVGLFCFPQLREERQSRKNLA
jgi:hypothetical protein